MFNLNVANTAKEITCTKTRSVTSHGPSYLAGQGLQGLQEKIRAGRAEEKEQMAISNEALVISRGHRDRKTRNLPGYSTIPGSAQAKCFDITQFCGILSG